jgi:hypothetical protein
MAAFVWAMYPPLCTGWIIVTGVGNTWSLVTCAVFVAVVPLTPAPLDAGSCATLLLFRLARFVADILFPYLSY